MSDIFLIFENLFLNKKIVLILLFWVLITSCAFKNSGSQKNNFSLRQINCIECNSLPSSYDINFALDFDDLNLTPTIYKYIDTVVCNTTDTIQNLGKPLNVFIFKDTKKMKLLADDEPLYDSDHLYSNKMYLYLVYTWNSDGEFMYKGGHNQEFISDTLICN